MEGRRRLSTEIGGCFESDHHLTGRICFCFPAPLHTKNGQGWDRHCDSRIR
jgi:hypothetical protein